MYKFYLSIVFFSSTIFDLQIGHFAVYPLSISDSTQDWIQSE